MIYVQHIHLKHYYRLILIIFAITLSSIEFGAAPIQAANNGLGALPLMGWSSWSLESTSFPGYGIPFLTAQNLISQSDFMHQKLQAAGYNYFNIDSGWWMDSTWRGGHIQGDQYDGYGRPIPDATRFPNGIMPVINHVKANGQHVGMYYIVGLPRVVYDANTPILGTGCHAQDIAIHPLQLTNGWLDHWAIDFSNPCAQVYINSIADQFASWGIDFLKVDGVLANNQADVKAWSIALQQTGRPIWLTLSWALDRKLINFWKQYANAARISGDVECYCGSLVTWSHNVVSRFADAPAWVWLTDAGYKNELDSLDIGASTLDGLSNDERQSYMTLWAISSANLLVGDDMKLLDNYGISLLTNPEVITQDQAGKAARPVSQSGDQQVWWVHNTDGSYTVALFNLNDTRSSTVTANWNSFGLSGTSAVHDMWSHTDLGSFKDSWSATLAPHASRLIKVTPQSTGSISTLYEAEAAVWSGTAVDRPCGVCSGGRKVANIGNKGTLTFTVTASSAGIYYISLRYMNGDTSPHMLHLSINSSDTALSLDPTGGWFMLSTFTTPVNLAAGNNTLKLYNPNADTGPIDLDMIVMPPPSIIVTM